MLAITAFNHNLIQFLSWIQIMDVCQFFLENWVEGNLRNSIALNLSFMATSRCSLSAHPLLHYP